MQLAAQARAPTSAGRITGSRPTLKQFWWKMSPRLGAMTARMPAASSAHTAASREEPQPKFSAVTRILAARKAGWLRTNSGRRRSPS